MSDVQTVEKRGLICPRCNTLADEGDAFCAGGDYDFLSSDPKVGVNAQGQIVEVDGVEINPVTTLSEALAAAGKPVRTAAAPVVAAPPVVPAAALPAAPVVASVRRVLEIAVDTSPRDGRPDPGSDDYADPPASATRTVELTHTITGFGRLQVGASFVLVDGDSAVSRLHGYFRLEGDRCVVENQSGSGIFVRGLNHLIANKGDRYELKPGDQLEVGDWYTITYREEN